MQVETINHWLVKYLDIGWTSVTSPELPRHFGIKLKADTNHVWSLYRNSTDNISIFHNISKKTRYNGWGVFKVREHDNRAMKIPFGNVTPDKSQIYLLSYRHKLEAWNLSYNIFRWRKHALCWRLRGCAGWPGPLKFAYGVTQSVTQKHQFQTLLQTSHRYTND